MDSGLIEGDLLYLCKCLLVDYACFVRFLRVGDEQKIVIQDILQL